MFRLFGQGLIKIQKNTYGWYSYYYHLLSWILSSYQLSKFYDNLILYTDDFGYDLLINKLKLPYKKVYNVLNDIGGVPEDLWAMSKIKVYSLQKEPFLHVDGDVFIWEKFPEQLLNSSLICQNKETTTVYYREKWDQIFPNLKYLPKEMENFHSEKSNSAYNMGIFGGNDIEFISKYCEGSYNFVFNNRESWSKFSLLNFNVFFEQVYLHELASIYNKKIDILIKDDIGDNQYKGFGDFELVPFEKKYLHLLGVYKQSEVVCRKMEEYLFLNMPETLLNLRDNFSDVFNFIDFNYNFSQQNNDNLIKKYNEYLEGRDSFITKNEKLFSRNLFVQNHLNKFLSNENDNQILFLLPEVKVKKQKGEKYLYVDEIGGEFFLKKMSQVEEIVLYELQEPTDKKSFYKRVYSYLDVSLSKEEVFNFKNLLDQTIKDFITSKIIAITN